MTYRELVEELETELSSVRNLKEDAEQRATKAVQESESLVRYFSIIFHIHYSYDVNLIALQFQLLFATKFIVIFVGGTAASFEKGQEYI